MPILLGILEYRKVLCGSCYMHWFLKATCEAGYVYWSICMEYVYYPVSKLSFQILMLICCTKAFMCYSSSKLGVTEDWLLNTGGTGKTGIGYWSSSSATSKC